MFFRKLQAFFICGFLPIAANAMGRAPKEAPAPSDRPARKIVVIDAGHGGKNEGAVVYGRKERDIVLKISLRLQEIFEARRNLVPYLTRWDDDFVALTDRVTRSEAVGGDVFLSLHVDNNRVRKGRGVMMYVYGKNKTIPEGPEREKGEKILPPPPKKQLRRSRRLAEKLRRDLRRSGIKVAPYVDRGAFAVLKSARMPSVLVELGNLRDKKEAALLEDEKYQEKLARALADSVESYLANR